MASTPQIIPDFKSTYYKSIIELIDKTWKSNMKAVELIKYTSETIENILLENCREETDNSLNHLGCPPEVIGNVIDDDIITGKIFCIKEYIIEKYTSDKKEK